MTNASSLGMQILENITDTESQSETVSRKECSPPSSRFTLTSVLVSWTAWTVYAIYLLFMPVYVPYLNAHYANNTCTTPTWDLMHNMNITCVNGKDLTELARQAGRFNANGDPVACGCSEGIFGEDICPLGFAGHPTLGGATISNYIGTPTGTGSFAVLTLPVILIVWFYGTGSKENLRDLGHEDYRVKEFKVLTFLAQATLLLGQIFFFWFEVFCGCVLYDMHVQTSGAFQVLIVAHYLLVFTCAAKTKQYVPAGIIAVCLVAFLLSALMFMLAGQRFTDCNIVEWVPGHERATIEAKDGCMDVLENPFAQFYWEVITMLWMLAVAPLLVTYAYFTHGLKK